MRGWSIYLLSLAFFAASGLAAAAQPAPAAGGPIVTGAVDASPEAVLLAAPPAQPAAPPTKAVTPVLAAGAVALVRRPAGPPRPVDRQALRAEREPGELVEFSRSTSLFLRRVGTPGVTGGLLQSNPHLEKRERRQLGLAMRF